MRYDSGLTLLECLFVVLVGTALLAIGAPAFGELVRNARLQTALAQLHVGLETTRSHAIKSGHSAVICKSASGDRCTTEGNWDQGWMVFIDRDGDRNCIDADHDHRCDADGGEIVLIEGPVGRGRLSLTGNQNIRNRVVFNSRGAADGYPGTFTACDNRGVAKARGLIVSMIGRIRPATTGDLSCSVAAD